MKHNKTQKNRKDVLAEKLKLLRRVSMSEEEKDRMSSFLSRYVELHPVLGEQERVIKARKETYSALSATFRRFTPAFAVLTFFVWGGVTLAEASLPGEALYGVKTVSENVRESFSFNAEWKARFEAEQINRRLNESHQLLERGKVSERSIEELARELTKSLDDLERALTQLEENSEHLLAFEIEKASRSSISVYRDVFVRMSKDNENVQNFLSHVALQFGLPQDHFALKDEGSFRALASEEGNNIEMSTLSIAEEAPDDMMDGDMQIMSDSSEDQMMMAIESDEDGAPEIESTLDLETLKLYASVRISETEKQLESARRVDKRLREALLLRLEEAERIYENAVSAEGSEDESVARSLFINSLSIVEDVRSMLMMGSNKPSELFILTMLKKLESEGIIEDPNLLLELEEEVRGVRKSVEEPDLLNEKERDEGNRSAREEEESDGEEVNLEEVYDLLNELEL